MPPLHFIDGKPTDALIEELEFWECLTRIQLGLPEDSSERERRFLTREEFVTYQEDIQADFEAEQTPEEKLAEDIELEAATHALKALGLIDPSADLVEEIFSFLDTAVAGFYSPETDELSVVLDDSEGRFTPSDFKTYVHEYLHFIQSTEFDAFNDDDEAARDSDVSTAFTAMIEGSAEAFAQIILLQTWGNDYLQAAFKSDPGTDTGNGEEQEDETPYLLLDAFLFPYTNGVSFASEIIIAAAPFFPAADLEEARSNGEVWAGLMRSLHERPPVTTEQVLHPEKYESNEPALVVDLGDASMLAAAGWTEFDRDPWGEGGLSGILETLLFERGGGGAFTESALLSIQAATTGWGGDEAGLMTSECAGTASMFRVEWDAPTTDGPEFNSALVTACGLDTRFTAIDGADETVAVFEGPVGYVAMPRDRTSEVSIFVTADSLEIATNLTLWMMGEAELADSCAT